MKTKLSLVIVFIFFLFSCKKDGVDLAKDIDPRIPPTNEVVNILSQIQNASSDEERGDIISDNEWLTMRMISYARELNQIPKNSKIDSVVYYFGSSNAQAEDKTTKLFKGKIIEETVGFIYYDGKKDPVLIIVYCQNGTFGVIEGLRRIRTSDLEFVIKKGEGINHHVDYLTSIMLAEHFRLPLYRGKSIADNNLISASVARGLENQIDRIQVTVLVYPGDYFNLATMTYRRAF